MKRPPSVPAPLHDDLLEPYLARHARAVAPVYLPLVFAVLAACASLPFLRVSLSVQGRGLIRPELEKHELAAPAGGYVLKAPPPGPRYVRPGDTLLVLRSDPLTEKGEPLRARIAEREGAIHDLVALLQEEVGGIEPGRLRLPGYREELTTAQAELRGGAGRAARARRAADRASALLQLGLAPLADVEELESRLEQLESDAVLSLQRRRSAWQMELAAARRDLADLRLESDRLRLEAGLYSIRSPVEGTVEETASLSTGSYVQPGQRVAVISPSTPLVAEVLVSPSDIGLIRLGTPVRLQIDAFRHTEWGFVAGRISDISGDFVLTGDRPAFRVRVRPESAVLSLRSGARGELKKGMTLTARFTIGRRSLWQLLRDDATDWLDPTRGGVAAVAEEAGR